MTEQWCILRTSGTKTMQLADSLVDAGFTAWTPVERRKRRKPRSKALTDIRVPVLPTYVFAASQHLVDLLAEADSATTLHPAFSVFKYFDRYPLIADRQLHRIRAIEERTAEKPRPLVSPGQPVKTVALGFEGLTGTVESVRGGKAFVTFEGFAQPIMVDTLLLLRDGVTDEAEPYGTAAQAA